jgi:hypothetical protein
MLSDVNKVKTLAAKVPKPNGLFADQDSNA